MTETVFLLEATPYQPGVGAVTVRMSSARSHDRDVVKNGQRWEPAIIAAPTQTIRLLGDDDLPGVVEIDYGQVGIRILPGNDIWSNYVWDGAAVSIWRGTSGNSFANFVKIFTGKCGPMVRPNANGGSITLRGSEADIDKNLLTSTYAGTGGAEGNLAMKGVPKPWLSGACEAVEAVLVDKINWIFQLHGYGAMDAITAAYEGGISLGAAHPTVPTTYAALAALTAGSSAWAVAPAIGMARLFFEPSQKIVFDARGALDGGSYVSKAAAIASHLMKQSGIAAGSISTASASAVDAAFPHDWGCYHDTQINTGDVIRQAMANIGGYTFPDENGLWRFGRYKALKTALPLNSDRTTLPLVRSVGQQPSLSPVGRVEVGARRAWSVHSETEISPALLDALSKVDGIEPGATVGAPAGTAVNGMPVEQSALGSDSEIFESFSSYPSFVEFDRVWDVGGSAAAVRQFVSAAGTPGGKYLEHGTATGPGYIELKCRRFIPYSAEDLYEVSFEVEFPEVGGGASNIVYVGIAGIDKDGNNVPGNGTYHYVAANAASISAGRYTYRGYFRGYGTTAVSTDPANPTPLSAGVVKIALLALLRYNTGTGRTYVHSASLKKLEDVAVVWTGAWSSSRTYRYAEGVTSAEGHGFASRQNNNLNNQPPTTFTTNSYWTAVVKKGDEGAAGAAAKTLALISDRQTITYDSSGAVNPTTQTTTFSVLKQNTSATVNWTATRTDGVSISPVTLLLSAATGDSVTMTAANFNSNRGSTLGVVVTATLTDGVTLTDRTSVVKVQDGAQGVPGGSLYTWIAYANSADGTLDFTNGAPGARVYIGIATNKTSSTESAVPGDYTWSAYAGPPSFGLVGRGQAIVAGNTIIKNGGAVAWDSDVYSSEGWTNGAFCSFKFGQTTGRAMAGLNSDPLTDSSYTSIDYAWFGNNDGSAAIYEGGGSVATGFTYDTTTVFSVIYDGKTIRYLRNGVVVRTLAVAANLKLYFDSSIETPSARITEIAFGPSGSAGTDGINGADGASFGSIYQRSVTQPATPSASTTTPAGWYETTGDVPAGSSPMWVSAWTRATPAANRIYQTPVRFEAVSAVATGQTVPLAFTVSTALSFSLGPGLSRIVNGQGRLDTPAGAGTVYVQIESRVAGGTWSASNGAAEPYAVGEPAVPTHQITITNSGGTTVNYEVRGTVIRSNSNSGPLTASESVLSI